ncbi:MAG TPA: UDP-N-acetylmuramate--L-alanine ligase [Actinomycetota bacterium]|nr:UDP-N-acetylmuramate--L-alanine ligase [Actinomycetota bacterium]
MKAYRPPAGSIPTLPVPDLSGITAVHLVGMGGAGMSGLARLLLARGVRVSGSDLKDSEGLHQLRAAGATVFVGHDAGRVEGTGAVVVSSAIDPQNVEVLEARQLGVPVLARAQVLAALMGERRGIAVAGTHGKTTTTSMLAVILERAGTDPTYLVGGDLNESGSNARWGNGDLFLAEADESDGSFLLLRPDVAVVTNVEDDHLDFYGDREAIEAAFVGFCRGAGLVVACRDDRGAVRVAEAAGGPTLWYGTEPGSEVAIDSLVVGRGGGRARIRIPPAPNRDGWTGSLEVPMPGRQHLLNAVGAVAAAVSVGIPPDVAARAVGAFGGVRRRWEVRGTARGATLVDDYAHHPTEIEATIAAARSDGASRLVAVFQPHRYSRTEAMWRPLGESLAGADLVVITDVYAAGEGPVPGVTGKLLVDALAEAAPGKRTVYLPHRADVAPFLARELREGDLVLTLGAGDVTMVGDETLALLEGVSGRG